MAITASAMRPHLLRLLESGRPTTTSELVGLLNDSGLAPTYTEAVYRNLLVLERRGLVKRVAVRGRHAYWVATPSVQAE